MEIIRNIEFDIEPTIHSQITNLRNICFPETQSKYSYYKQLPHFRYLAFEGRMLIAHLAIDCRVISVGTSVFSIFGLVDLCVIPSYQKQGIATRLITLLTDLAKDKSVDFLFLVANNKEIYFKNGFRVVSNYCSWLRIHEHKNYGVAVEKIENEFMIKQIGTKIWVDEPIDLLGYMF